MSVKYLSWAFDIQGLTCTQKCVLLALADRCDHDGRCWPSYDDIRARTGCNRKTIAKVLDAMEQKGLISKCKRFGGSTVYTLHSSTENGPISSTKNGTISSTKNGTLTVNEPPIKDKTWEPPLHSECMEYARSKGLVVDVDIFFEYYSGTGWRDAKGNPVKNWKLKMIQWNKREQERKPAQPIQQGFDDRGASYWT